MAAQTNAPLPNGHEFGHEFGRKSSNDSSEEAARYRIVKKIASGGFSIVYLARDADGNEVAIKEYLPSALATRRRGELVPQVAPENLAAFRIGLKCFFEEGRALAGIVHSHVVSVLNFFRANDTVYMVMEYEAGRTLQDYILRRRRRTRQLMPTRILLNIFHQVMDGLREVHAHKLLHLDLKPANIYLREDGSAMLLDFGAARQIQKSGLTRFYPMYTPGFAAPELYDKNGKLGPWTDIYGIGACMYASMAGAPPQAADQRRIDDQMARRLGLLAEHYPADLLGLARWCLQLDLAQRPPSVFALQMALRDCAVPGPAAALAPTWVQRLHRIALTPISMPRLVR
jgi:hypothetical protein